MAKFDHSTSLSLSQYQTLCDNSIDGTFFCTPAGDLLMGNQAFADMLGFSSFDEMKHARINLKNHIFHCPDDFTTLSDRLNFNDSLYCFEALVKLKNSESRWTSINAKAVRHVDDCIPVLFHGSVRDIHRYKSLETRLRHADTHDRLTGLFNRNTFINHLDKAIARGHRNASFLFTLICIDINRLRIINESLGHKSGDRLIRKLAQIISNCLRAEDVCARLTGDEFGLLLTDTSHMMDSIRVIERINNALKAPIPVEKNEIFASVCYGILMSANNYSNSEDMLRDAETAMHRAKLSPNCSFAIFNEDMQKQALDRLNLETHLRRALDKNEFLIYYQPIVSLETRSIIAFEALLRWQKPNTGLIMPFSFIPLLEETGLIIPVGTWVLEEACRQTLKWQTDFPSRPPLMISVNVSAKQLNKDDFVSKVGRILKKTGLSPSCLKLEITESVVMEQSRRTEAVLNRLKSLGLCLSIDDFGTGYSSLAYLNQFPMDILKVDKSFIGQVKNGNKGGEIIDAIISLSHHLDKKVIVEGIETPQHYAQLKNFRCDYGQGYYFSKPLCKENATILLSKGLPI